MAILNSIIFHTQDLEQIRRFYTEILGLKVASSNEPLTPVQPGSAGLRLVTADEPEAPPAPITSFESASGLDQSDMHVNFDLQGTLLCFEVEEDRFSGGTLLLYVDDLVRIKDQLRSLGIPLGNDAANFLLLEDPEGREIILEQV